MEENLIKESTSYYRDYLQNRFTKRPSTEFSILTEPHIKAWKNYLTESLQKGVFQTLQSKLVQFQFPIQKSLSKTEGYKKATLSGMPTEKIPTATGLKLVQTEQIQLSFVQGPVGEIPVLVIPDSDDFANVVRALAHKNEPVKVPSTMGASLIRGLNNWDRIHTLKKEWSRKNTCLSWSSEFKNTIIPNKPLYQDTLMLLSHKPYSGIACGELGLSENEWLKKSMTIRIYHEYAHYFTLRVYGKMSKNLYDELLADYLGISMAFGTYKSHLFMKFMGLEGYPKYKRGSRLENYVELDQLSKEEFEELKALCLSASLNIEQFDSEMGASAQISERIKRLNVLCQFNWQELAKADFQKVLVQKYATGTSLNSDKMNHD